MHRENTMKKLQLKRTTIRNLTNSQLEQVGGAGAVIIASAHTCFCPVQTNGCTGGPCVVTIGTGTSVINPSGG